MLKKFFGEIGIYGNTVSANYHVSSIHVSAHTGLITRIDWQSSASGNIKPQIYHGTVWDTSERILYSDAPVATAIGLNTMPISPTAVTLGDTYWFAGCTDTNGVGTTRVVTGGAYKYKSATYSTFTAPIQPGSAGYGTVTNAALRVEVYGFTPPVITSINGGASVANGDTGVALVGTDLVDSSGNPTLWLCSTSNFATAPIKVAQTVTGSPTDTGLTTSIVQGGLSAGTVYAFAVSALGQVSAPIAVTLTPSGPVFDMDKIMDLSNNPIGDTTSAQLIGYTESTQDIFPLRMYNFLLHPIREADQTREGAFFVKRLFEGPQQLWQKTQDKIKSLKNLHSVTDCPDEALKYLKWITGWTSELDYITDDLDDVTLRKLIATSPALWKERGKEETIANIISTITNSRCVIFNWFDYRWIIDENEFCELREGFDSWMVPSGQPENGEFFSTLRIVDDGTLNRALVKNMLKLMRACNERFEIAYIDFLDNFVIDGDNSQWATLAGAGVMVANGVANLDGTSTYQMSIAQTEYSMDWSRHSLYCKIQGTGNYGFGVVFYAVDVLNYYKVELNVANSTCALFKISNGVSTLLSSNGALDAELLESIWYGLRIQTEHPDSLTTNIRVYINNVVVIDTSDFAINVALAGSGTGGKIFRSDDYGLTWSEAYDSPEAYIRSLSILTNGVALAGSSVNGKIFRSDDYGLTWSEAYDTTESALYSISFFQNGVAIISSGSNGKIFRSDNYGLTWTEIYDSTETTFYGLAIFENGVALACSGNNGKIFRSDNYGLTWTEIYDSTEDIFYAIATFENGVALVGGNPNGKIFRSDNYGLTWSEVYDSPETTLYAIATFENGVALAGGDTNGKIYRSDNYGLTWVEIYDSPETKINSISTYSNGVALAGSGPNGKIYRSDDYGLTWVEIYDSTEITIQSITTLDRATTPLNHGSFGFFANAGANSSAKLGGCELFQLPLDTDIVDINT